MSKVRVFDAYPAISYCKMENIWIKSSVKTCIADTHVQALKTAAKLLIDIPYFSILF